MIYVYVRMSFCNCILGMYLFIYLFNVFIYLFIYLFSYLIYLILFIGRVVGGLMPLTNI